MSETVNHTTGRSEGRTGVPISLVNVTKTYPGAATAAVDNLTMDIPAGEIVMLVGPSGCGKTTTMRMINRLIEPTSGQILIDGKDVMTLNDVRLRRTIGYVIQQVGLFPHLTIAHNIALVPKLLNWDKKKIQDRVDEMLDMVGLDPSEYRRRYPHELSGGQQQRVGVARALAADPPIMLMDEPFGAVDPITRSHLQDEFLSLQRDLRKTIVFVTHDFEEAVKMGDRIAILNEGSTIAQYATPEEILTEPANEFVEGFLGDNATIMRLSLERVDQMPLQPVAEVRHQRAGSASTVTYDSTLRDVLEVLLAEGADWVTVERRGQALGRISLDDVLQRVRELRDNGQADARA